jgi:ubiquinone/menaquinone biosynthesis C-methylase UbiE
MTASPITAKSGPAQKHHAPDHHDPTDATYSNPDAYDLFMGRWSARLAPSFVRFAGIRNGERVLDAGCGTGSLSLTLLAAGDEIRVVGVDPAEDYVAFARRRTPDSRAVFRVGAAESLPFPDESFDAAMALLVLQEFDDPVRAVREMARTTRHGGRIAACLWDFVDGMPMTALFWQAAEAVAPETVARRRAERPPCRIGLRELKDLWSDAGLSEVRTESLEISQAFSSFDDYWQPFISGCTPLSTFAAAVDRETRGEIANILCRLIPNVQPDGSFILPARALAVAGITDHS